MQEPTAVAAGQRRAVALFFFVVAAGDQREPVAGELRKLRNAALLVLPRWTAKRQTSPVSRRLQPRLLA